MHAQATLELFHVRNVVEFLICDDLKQPFRLKSKLLLFFFFFKENYCFFRLFKNIFCQIQIIRATNVSTFIV